jgi:hypothetical protein
MVSLDLFCSGISRTERTFRPAGNVIKIVATVSVALVHPASVTVTQFDISRAPSLEGLSGIDKPPTLIIVKFGKFQHNAP